MRVAGYLLVLLMLTVAGRADSTRDSQAPVSSHWSYQSLVRQPVPQVRNAVWPAGVLDSFILRRLEQHDLPPAGPADRGTWLRRVYLDVIGLPPTSSQVDAFVNDPSPVARQRMIDRLLADPGYGERWARFWLDLARYSDTVGYEGDPEVYFAWRYRDYVIDAFNTDKPFNRFVTQQLAGDEISDAFGAVRLPKSDPEGVVATTFLRLAPFTEPRGDKTRHEMLSEMTSTVGSVFLGMTIGCAQCHDHKYDEISTKDFYRMKAFFATVELPAPLRDDTYQVGQSLPAPFYRHGQEQRVRDLKKEIHREIEAAEKSKNKAHVKTLENVLLRLRPMAYALTHSLGPPFGPGVPASYVMVRGEYDNFGERVWPGFPVALTGHQRPAKIRLDPYGRWPTRGRRLALAKWIADPDNPLVARVLVNRLWQHHFGRGIVATPSDFGNLGAEPTHPELLDWLARRFVENRWSIKSLQRLMLVSSTYGQASDRTHAKAQEADTENHLLWKFRRRRLEGEAIRDSILQASGRLNRDLGGLPVFPPLPDDLAERQKVMGQIRWETSTGPETRKRSIYIFQRRSLNMPLLDAFDARVVSDSCALRRNSVTALQSLSMYNGPLVNTELPHLVKRVRSEAGTGRTEQIQCAFRLALGRLPTSSEQDQALDLLAASQPRSAGLAGLCRVLLNTNEFIYVD